jgi:hypothetical protein
MNIWLTKFRLVIEIKDVKMFDDYISVSGHIVKHGSNFIQFKEEYDKAVDQYFTPFWPNIDIKGPAFIKAIHQWLLPKGNYTFFVAPIK